MKRSFPGYYEKKSKEELVALFGKARIAVDTNILLNLYSCSKGTLDAWLSTFEAVKDKLWLPHQVAQEYHHNLEAIIRTQLKTKVENIVKDIHSLLGGTGEPENESNLKKKVTECSAISSECSQQIFKEISEFKKTLSGTEGKILKLIENSQSDYIKRVNDTKDKVASIFDGKVGNPYEADELEFHCKLAQTRFLQRIPPGYADKKKEEKHGNPYGDAILWFQILDFAKLQFEPVILVTADRVKEDWFYLDYEGKHVGPRAELISEMKTQSRQDFHLYRAETFLKVASDLVQPLQIADEVVEESKSFEPVSVFGQTTFTNQANKLLSFPAGSFQTITLHGIGQDLFNSLSSEFADSPVGKEIVLNLTADKKEDIEEPGKQD